MNIVYAVTRNVYHTIIPSIRSLVAYNPEVKIFLLIEDDEFPYDLPVNPSVINVSGQEIFPENSVNFRNRFKYINLLKVCYPSLLPMDKVIHMDADTIVCDSLNSFWDTDIEGKWFAACPEYNGQYKPFGDMYYNMGVALINLEQMRKDGAEAPMTWYLRTVRQPWADQDAWNLFGMAYDKIKTLPVCYNESPMTGITDHPAIVHFCSITDWWDNKVMYRHELLERWKQ